MSLFHDLDWIDETKLAFTVMDGFPVTEGHQLIVPKREVIELPNLTNEELIECFRLINRAAARFECDGYNMGVNQGWAAGQTILQLHFHVIPRRTSDVVDPTGGIRQVIPGKGNYRSKDR